MISAFFLISTLELTKGAIEDDENVRAPIITSKLA